MMPWIIEPFLVGAIIGVMYIVVSKWREWTDPRGSNQPNCRNPFVVLVAVVQGLTLV